MIWSALSLPSRNRHVAVQVVAVRPRGPLEADDGGEAPGLVVFLGGRRDPLPRRLGHGLFLAFERVFQLLHGGDPHVEGGSLPFDGAGLGQVVYLLAPFRLEQCGIGFRDHRREAQVLGVVGNHQKIERSRQLDGQAAVRLDLFAASKPISVLGPDDGAGHAGIGGVRGMQVRVAEVHAVGKRLRRVRRVGDLLVRRSRGVLRKRLRAAGQQDDACHRGHPVPGSFLHALGSFRRLIAECQRVPYQMGKVNTRCCGRAEARAAALRRAGYSWPFDNASWTIFDMSNEFPPCTGG